MSKAIKKANETTVRWQSLRLGLFYNTLAANIYISSIFSKTLLTFPEFRLGRVYAFEIFTMVLIMLFSALVFFFVLFEKF